MFSRLPTKLFRMICKRAALMRAPFGDGKPWTSAKPPTIKKSLLQNQIQSTLQSAKKTTSESSKKKTITSEQGKQDRENRPYLSQFQSTTSFIFRLQIAAQRLVVNYIQTISAIFSIA